MENFSDVINNLLNNGITRKNYIIVLVLVLGAIFYLLGIDIKYIKDITYINIFMLIGLLIYSLINGSLILNKIDDILNKNDNMSDTIDLMEKNIESTNYVKSKIDDLDLTIKNHDKRLLDISSDISNKPNITTSKLIINSYIKNMFNDIFEECLNYTLIVSDGNNEIALNNLKDDINRTIKKQINSIYDIIKVFDSTNTLSEIIKEKTNKMVEVIINDIQKNKKINEKLYTINLILRETRKELRDDINNYLREIQTKLFD